MSQVTANQCHNLLRRPPLVPSGILLSSRVFTTRHRFSGLLDFRSRKSTWIPTQRIPLAAELQSAFSWFSTTVDAYLHHYEYHRGLAEFRLCIYWEGSATLCSRRRRRMPHPHRTAQCRKEGYEVWRKQPIKQPMTATTLVDWEAPEMKSSLGPLPKEKFNLGDRKRMVQQRTTSTFFSTPYLLHLIMLRAQVLSSWRHKSRPPVSRQRGQSRRLISTSDVIPSPRLSTTVTLIARLMSTHY